MNITVHFFAGLRERAGVERLVMEDLDAPLDVTGLKRVLTERLPELGSLQSVRGVLDDTYVPDGTLLSDGCHLHLLPPVSGGLPELPEAPDALEAGVFELHAEALDPLDAQRRVAHPACGGTVLFTGTTRERNRDKDVVELDYEAFAAMAGKEMARIYADCLTRFGPASAPGDLVEPGDPIEPGELRLRMLTLHRTGKVGVGEPSVVIAVSSPHRDAAFRACRFLIDELKARIPLWKREVYRDGHHWVGDRS